MKKIISIVCALVLMFTITCDIFGEYFSNDGDILQNSEYIYPNMQISGTNSFGNMLSEVIGDELAEQQENAGYNVYSVEISGQTATAELEALSDSTVVVGIYDETGSTLLITGSADVTHDDEYVSVTFPKALPDYFYIKAYLIDRETLRPLCTVYECPNYTHEMQEFFSKTIYDFDQSKVLNLDDDATNNFAVYSGSVTVIPNVDGVNVPVSTENGVYVFANADENILSLQPGQIFSYEHAPGEVIIAKVAAVIENPDGTVTVTEQDAELEDAFEYIKIDTEAGMDKTEIDNSNLEEGVEFAGMTNDPESYGVMPTALEGEITSGGSAKYNINIKDFGDDNAKVSLDGSVYFSLNAGIKYYATFDYQYIEVTLAYKATVSLSVEGKVKGKFELGDFGISPVPGLYIGITPSVVLEFSLKLTLSGTASGSVGFTVSSLDGCSNISKPINFSSKLEVEGRVYLGFSLEPKIKIIDEKVAEVKLTAQTGLELTAKTSVYDTTTIDKQIHDCDLCFEGALTWVTEVGFKASLFNWDKLTWTAKWEFRKKLFDYYYSVTHNELGNGICPYIRYRVDVLVTDSVGGKIEGAEVTISDGQKFKTGEDGRISAAFLPNGWYTITAKLGDRSPCSKKIFIQNSGESVVLPIGMNFAAHVGEYAGPENELLTPNGSKKVKQVSCGEYNASAAVTVDGDLYTWGNGGLGGLGNGSTFEVDSPKKIMENVEMVSMGFFNGAAVKENGDLYVWGYNKYGLLGNDRISDYSTVPIKIMGNIAYVDISQKNVAAITTMGDLYMWGSNDSGQLGDGTLEDSLNPKKIMSNVISVSLGNGFAAAVTSDGTLYTWGNNYEGQLGNGTFENSSVPIKILDNIKSVDLGYDHSSAITNDGQLYVWGRNFYWQLGYMSNFDYGNKGSNVPLLLANNIISSNLSSGRTSAINTNHELIAWGGGVYGNGWYGLERKEMDDVYSVSTGGSCAGVIKSDGNLYMWGSGTQGNLGNGSTNGSSEPIIVEFPAIDTYSAISTFSAVPIAEASPTSGTFTDLLPNEIYNIYAVRSRTAAEPLSSSNLLYISQATSDAAGNLPYSCELLEDCSNPVIFCKAMREFPVGNVQISGADITKNSITLKWDAYHGADMYRVYRVVNGIYLELGTTSETSFTVSGLNPNWEYGFLVSSRVNGEWSYPSSDDIAYIATEQEAYAPGDVNGDGEITLDDAILTLKFAMNVDLGDVDFIESAADVSGDDGSITLDDAIAILKMAMNVTL